jgi:triacylglycerol lipase
MTPRDYPLLAQETYSATPDIGKADSASRAVAPQTAVGLCIAYPGADNAARWAADRDALTVDVPGAGAVHCSFWEARGRQSLGDLTPSSGMDAYCHYLVCYLYVIFERFSN